MPRQPLTHYNPNEGANASLDLATFLANPNVYQVKVRGLDADTVVAVMEKFVQLFPNHCRNPGHWIHMRIQHRMLPQEFIGTYEAFGVNAAGINAWTGPWDEPRTTLTAAQFLNL